MRRKTLVRILSLWMLLVLLLLMGNAGADSGPEYPIMRADVDTWLRWQQEELAAPRANMDAEIERGLNQAAALSNGTSINLLDYIPPYDPPHRRQGDCENCWVWVGTGIMEMALYRAIVDAGRPLDLHDRLSVQYFDSCWSGGCACDYGGNMTTLAAGYTTLGRAIPWDNHNAGWHDIGGQCPSIVACDRIRAEPYRPVNSIVAQTIETHDISQSSAINNIKNVLNQRRGVSFNFLLPHQAAWDQFQSFWDCDNGETEESLWGSPYCGDDWNAATGGGHGALIVGYNDEEGEDNDYWIALNSWGDASGNRPNGLFRIPMHVFYDCRYKVSPANYLWAYGFGTLAVDFGNSPPVADAGGPYVAECQGGISDVQLDGRGSSDLDSPFMHFLWDADLCGDAFFDYERLPEPTLSVYTSSGCSVDCEVSLTVSDDSGGEDTDTAHVSIDDTQAPAIDCPADVTIECDGPTDPLHTGYATANDLCDEAPAVSYVDCEFLGACPAEKSIDRHWTATDRCDHSAVCLQTVNVVDTTPPKLLGVPPSQTAECDAVPEPPTVTATDSCDPGPTIHFTETRTDGACPNCYTLTWTWTAVDACGNSTTEERTVTVVDTTPPQLVGVPADVTVECDAVPEPATVTATDNCDPDPAVSFSEVRTDGACADSYTLTRTWTAVDACGNSTSAQQTVTVEDYTTPVLACNAPQTIYPSDAPFTFTAKATDNCDDAPLVEITGFDCFAFTKKGRRIDRTDNCIVELAGDSLTIVETGGVGSFITWNVKASDDCGFASEQVCQVELVRPERAQ